MNARMATGAGIAVCLLACTESPAPTVPSFSAIQATCPATPNVVVTTEGQLLDALATAQPGAVIGIDGLIMVTADVHVTTPNVTLTCVTAGSGLAAEPGGTVLTVLTAEANAVTVDRLFLDATNAVDPFIADGGSGVRFTTNSVVCGPALLGGGCALFNATPNAVISGNDFRSNGSFSGLHLQAGVDNSRIEDNTITTTVAGADVPIFGGLRIRDGVNVVVARNTVRGPWANSAALVNLAASILEQNDFDGSVAYGILAPAGSFSGPVAMTDNVIRGNRISGAGSAGIFLNRACGSQLFGNDLEGNAADVGLVFAAQTGANTFAGNQNLVFDNGGELDCNGDGAGDPNVITGIGLVRKGEQRTPPTDGPGAASRLQ